MPRLTRTIAAAMILIAGLSPTLAADFEKPPAESASRLLGERYRGPNYTVESPVTSDGFLRTYTLDTRYGLFRVSGDQLLENRLKELRAIDALDRTTASETFLDAARKAGLNPLDYAANLVTDPIGTVKNTVSGVGRLFEGIGAGIRNAGRTPDSALASATGQAKQKRMIAFTYGVDPYTDFPPLADRLDRTANAAALGGLLVQAAFIALPGAAGTVISGTSTAENLNNMVRDNSAAQLIELNRKKLDALDVDVMFTDELLENRHFTPVDVTAMVDAFQRLARVKDLSVMVERAALADSREIAFFIRRRVELIAAYQDRTGAITEFRRFGASPFPLCVTADNGIIGIFPIDSLAWTKGGSETLAVLDQAATAAGITGPRVLAITGTATKLATRKLADAGWTLQQVRW